LPGADHHRKNFRFFYELPLAYSDTDLRGAIYAAVVNATWNLQFTINPSFFVATGADATRPFSSRPPRSLARLTNLVFTVFQVYLDQLPFAGANPILPLFDLATGYLLINTTQTGLVVNQDFPIQYPNFRQILSTMFIYNNNGVNNPGTDIASIGIQAANLVFSTNPIRSRLRLKLRNTIGDDFPAGSYCIETRMQPINTRHTAICSWFSIRLPSRRRKRFDGSRNARHHQPGCQRRFARRQLTRVRGWCDARPRVC
jgi:hypothetical protein